MSKIIFDISPYKGADPIFFGMSSQEVESILGSPEDKYIDFLERNVEIRDDIFIKYNKKGLVNEITCSPGVDVLLNGTNIFKNKEALSILESLDTPEDSMGFKTFFKLGISLTGFSKKKESKTISVFSKEMKKYFED
ncbi:MAG TPA: hypothetical protein VLC79_17485 [Cellvibrio sp.]|nr:hypothetical protein [Cellvibrio sp.]